MVEKILLDTSVLIDIFDKNGNRNLLENECCLCVISIYEYIRYKEDAEEQILLLEGAFDIINFTNPVIIKASEIFVKLKKTGTQINENDIYIAASAIANKLKLYTMDGDFLKIKKLFPELQIVKLTN